MFEHQMLNDSRIFTHVTLGDNTRCEAMNRFLTNTTLHISDNTQHGATNKAAAQIHCDFHNKTRARMASPKPGAHLCFETN